MKFSMKWLEQELETNASSREIADKLTMIGLELENLDDPADRLKEFVVAHVEKAEKHPNADRLQVCQVNNGREIVEVVCGAPNARAGMKGVFAGNGMYIPGTDLTLKKSKIRGVNSNGMLLSEREMGLSDDHEGIVELPDKTPVGIPAAEAMGLNDPVFEIGITPNRGDCLGVRGIARDLAAAGIGKLKPLEIEPQTASFQSPVNVYLDFDEENRYLCPYFVGRYFRDIKNGDSPRWLQEKLYAIGLRPISSLVDITNLLTFAYGRPLHVFDADKLEGHIHVRLSNPDEKILALDGKDYVLDDSMIVISDEKMAEGLAGVMGGERSGCTAKTTNVFLEAAYFDPVRTAMTGRKLNLQSDARFRFERGIDPAFQLPGAELASKLILQICGGEASEMVIAGEIPNVSRKYFLRESRIKALGGVDISREEIERILTVLGFQLHNRTGGWDCSVPSWRHDVMDEADLVEEVLRINGFDNIPSVPLRLNTPIPSGAVNWSQEQRALARRVLATRGMTEAVTFSFLPGKHADLFGGGSEALKLVNPIGPDFSTMRPSLLPNLISAIRKNADRGTNDSALFELGPQFLGETPSDQVMAVSGVRVGKTGPRNWAETPRSLDVFDVKADVMDLLSKIGVPVSNTKVSTETPKWYHPGRSGSVQLGREMVLAYFGEIHPTIVKELDVDDRILGFEVFLDALPLPKADKVLSRNKLELSPYQSVERDFAFIVDENIAAEAVINAAQTAGKNLVTEVRIFDLFSGGGIGDGKKSIAITVVMQPIKATLTETEIDGVCNRIIANVNENTGGDLRS